VLKIHIPRAFPSNARGSIGGISQSGVPRIACSSSRARTQHVVSAHARARSIKRKCWFFYRAVVIRMQCSRSPRTLTTIATHSWLGGQHGEEAKDEDEVSGEKGRAQDKAPEEEVSYSPLQSSTSNDVVDCVTRAGASRRAVSALRRASTPPVPVGDRGRRRDRDSIFTDVGAAKAMPKGEGEGRRVPHLTSGSRRCRWSRAPASHRRPRFFPAWLMPPAPAR
jgi:hypothetical protein